MVATLSRTGVAHRPDGIRYGRPMKTRIRPVGEHLREWRQRRRMSQLDLACTADISARHLSFLETGRAQPSREMLLHLAEELDVPVRERNALLMAAGYAPVFPERPLDDPALPSYTGKFTVWGGFNQTRQTANGTFTFNVRGTGSDGSSFSNHVTDHFNQRPNGSVQTFFHCF